ncbi:oligosaccharide flippase family protein [Bradyrhizobium paxllaeri]|uniref:oligosaccharide flippase family protein n=1 Tax=Bradyrhizobium paxllaeri TaxID=190148 RepID=UPI000810D4A4|nr:oligosaccharide flippase family protein [Bradyrhizobium paxllaeri]
MSLSEQISLKQRVVKAGIWSLAGFAISLVIRLGSSLLMTRLLAPEMFGIMAVASTLIVGLAMFSDVGLKQSVVQSKRGHETAFLNTAWVIQILRGVLLSAAALTLCVVLVILGQLQHIPVNSVYAAPVLPYVVAVLSLSVLIAAFESTKVLEANRTILLGRIIGMEIFSQAIGLICMLGWVLVDRSIWALVAGTICSSLVRTVVSHMWLPGVANRWQWDRQVAHEVIHFGKWILLSSVFGFLASSGDRLLLGGLVDSTVLGLYAIASLFVISAEGVLSKIMTDVAFPALSEIVRTKGMNLKGNYYRLVAIIALVSYFSAGFLMTFGPSLIQLLYDPRYHEAGWMLGILAATLATMPFRLAVQAFLALGMPKIQSNVILVRLVSLYVLAPLGFYFFGLDGALIMIVFSHFSYLPIIIFYSLKHGLFDFRKELYFLVWVPIGLLAGKISALLVGHFL